MDKTTVQIDYIKEILSGLSKEAIEEVSDFTNFLSEKERKKKTFTERVLKIERESDTVTFDSVDDAMKAIREESD